jgi:hypothetical protein
LPSISVLLSTAAPLQGSPLMFHAGDRLAFWPHLPRIVFSAATAHARVIRPAL